jgi:hypothetical protein
MSAPANRLPWLEHGFSFLSGFCEEDRRRRFLVPLQIFVDESQGHDGEIRHFCMAALLSTAERWIAFSDAWKIALTADPAIHYFKMNEAATLSGEFRTHGNTRRRWTEKERDEKLASLARVINTHAISASYMLMDLNVHADSYAKLDKPLNDPYFWPFQFIIMQMAADLWDADWREKIELVFDENKISGTKASAFYPMLLETLEERNIENRALLPAGVLFRDDKLFMPLQAADLIAGFIRLGADKGGPYEWLRAHMPNLYWSPRSLYMDDDFAENRRKLLSRLVDKVSIDEAWQEAIRLNKPREDR